MNGAHDLGGMDGMGAIAPEPDEPVFHQEWERRIFALTLAAGFLGRWNIDMARFAREQMPGPDYLNTSYYEHWLFGLDRLLQETGLLRSDEPEMGHALRASEVWGVLRKGRSARRAAGAPPRFKAGDTVLARNIHPTGHTRLPRYARGKRGVVHRDHGLFVFPDSNGMGLGEKPQHCYGVRFTMQELWGADVSPRDSVSIDLWDDHLERA